jgi:hypothetical protein
MKWEANVTVGSHGRGCNGPVCDVAYMVGGGAAGPRTQYHGGRQGWEAASASLAALASCPGAVGRVVLCGAGGSGAFDGAGSPLLIKAAQLELKQRGRRGSP